MSFREIARAKVNLTLSVLGRRPDGYHEIESLVAFAGIGDRVTLSPGSEVRVEAAGPFAGDIVGENLLMRALTLLHELDPGLTLGAVRLEKSLPVAAGLGGGSADAAALLRAVRRANPGRAERVAWHAAAARLGADVPVCLAGVTALMSGVGDRIEPLPASPGLPAMAAVLVNPRLPLPTAQVYWALGAGPVPTDPPPRLRVGPFASLASLVVFMRAVGNDLERPAIALLPAVADIKAALGDEPGCSYAAMSGSGPTCFGIFADEAAASRAAAALAARYPHWWVVATELGEGSASPARASDAPRG
jgi:4-diphosphocytidyl-2-C-methyl-D-erythritol kinase